MGFELLPEALKCFYKGGYITNIIGVNMYLEGN